MEEELLDSVGGIIVVAVAIADDCEEVSLQTIFKLWKLLSGNFNDI
jgi:hypothetical protein